MAAGSAPLIIVGLGPGGIRNLTVEARRVLRGASEIWLRTRRHPMGSLFSGRQRVQSFDDVYERATPLRSADAIVAERVIALAARPEGVVYAVPGHPLVGDGSVRRIIALAKAAEMRARVVAGASLLDPVFAALALDPLEAGLQTADATAIASPSTAESGDRSRLWARLLAPRQLRPTAPALICQVQDRGVAVALKQALLELYPPEHPVTLVQRAGIAGQERITTLALSELDRRRGIDHLTCLYLPPLPVLEDLGSFAALRHIVARLRAPGGCPWDREQSHQSLKPYLLEESYEALEALDEGDMVALREELGDVLLQIVLHAQLAAEEDDFDVSDVMRGISAKLIRRHPHVFGDVRVAGSADVLRNWERIKQAEKGDEEGTKTTLLGGLPRHMPALARARSIQRRVADLGFEWDDTRGAFDKVAEEAAELAEAGNDEERLWEYGDLLFSLVSAGRFVGLDAEEALRLANERFVRRFTRLEEIVRARGVALKDLASDEIERLWRQAKERS